MSHRYVVLAALLTLGGLPLTTFGATLCVSAVPKPGCPYATITAGVNAAAPGDTVKVTAGTYHESVTINRLVSLVGENSLTTIIDATGLSVGINVNGLDHPMLTAVTVSGFQVQNANFEGILVTNATDITITGNHVLHNDLALNIDLDICQNQPAFETNEGFDCGEGIHLSGVDHSIVADNLVEKNAGGILLTDDTGAAHDNLIVNNVVQDNPFDCGITLASHQLYNSNPPVAAGVYHNTITGNTSQRNGLQLPGAGAGVGIFAGAPFNKTYGNVIVNNTLVGNGLPGVALHAHAPGANLSDNMIAANRISGNGADTADTATPGPAGVNVSGGDDGSGHPLAVITGTVIAANSIENETDAIVVKTNWLVAAHLNDLTSDSNGIVKLAGSIDATLNWWGCAGGPGAAGCAAVVGANILDTPFLPLPF